MISVIIPTYKPDDFCFQCLDSLNSQTLSKTLFEVVVVLNGEYEPYFTQVNKHKSSFPLMNLKILYTDIAGVSNARNIGIVNSTYNYIVFIDDDDIVSSNMLQSFYSKAIDNGIVAAKFKSFKYDLLNLTDDYVTRSYNRCLNYKEFNLIRFRGFLSSACGKLIPRSIIADNRFNTSLSKGEDSLFMFSISGSIKNILLAESDVIYYRRLRPGSATRNTKNKKQIISNGISLYKNYFFLYIKKPFYYNFFFFLTRLAAITKLSLKRLNHSQH